MKLLKRIILATDDLVRSNKMTYEVKKVAVICLIKKDGKYLFVKRAHTGKCDGYYMLPGGHVDEGEGVLQACIRELKEELDIVVKSEDLVFCLAEPTQTHVHFFFEVLNYAGVIKNNEPKKHDDVSFLSLDDEKIHPVTLNEIKEIEKGTNFFESNQLNF